MKQKSLVLIALAVVCGLGAMFMTSKLLADRQGESETVKVIVVKKYISAGTIIKVPEDFFEEKEVAKDLPPKLAMTKLEDVKNRQFKIPRRPGDYVTAEDLWDANSPGLTTILPPNHRAVGIRVSSEQISAGFAAVPHSRVDISCTITCKTDKDCGSRIILQNVLVLASGQEAIRADGKQAMLCDVVTVALTPEQALSLECARAKGSISLYLRPFGESTLVSTNNRRWEDVINTAGSIMVDEEAVKKASGGGVGDIGPITPVTPVKVEAPPPVERPFVQRVTNNGVTTKITYTRGPDGEWDAFTEVVEEAPAISPNPGTKAAVRATSAVSR